MDAVQQMFTIKPDVLPVFQFSMVCALLFNSHKAQTHHARPAN